MKINRKLWRSRRRERKNALLGLIPGYSGLYRTGSYLGGGLFTVLETAALVNFMDVYNAKKAPTSYMQYLGSSDYLAVNMNFAYIYSGLASPAQSFFSSSAMVYFLQGTKVHNYSGSVTRRGILRFGTENSFYIEKNYAAAALGLLLAADAGISYLSAVSWNEGSYISLCEGLLIVC